MASGFWGRARRAKQAQQAEIDAHDKDLAMKAGVALVDADERIRLMNDELSFAEAELGSSATQDLKDALVNVRKYMGEAFHLNQLNVDDIPDTPDELRTRNARIVQICEWAMGLLEEKSSVLEEAVAIVRQTPAVLEGVKRDSERLRARIPDAQASIDRLALRYSDAALHQVGDNPAEAAQLLTFAEHSADVSMRRRDAGQNEQSRLALEASTEAVRRVHTLLDAVENYEIEALRAESTLAAVIADSRGDLVAARDVPRTQEVEDAAKRLTDALAALPPAGERTDPFASLSRLRAANTGLDEAIAKARDRAARPIPSQGQVSTAIDDADRQIAVANDVISGHRGWIGSAPRTRLAEAERIRNELVSYRGGEDEREQALALARRAGSLASEALQLAQRDIDESRPQQQQGYDDWGQPRGGGYQGGYGGRGGRRGGDMGDVVGGVLGGLMIGGLLDGMFD